MKALCEWLESLETVKSAIPCAVRIGQRNYYGAAYHNLMEIKNSDGSISKSYSWRFYLLGDKPKHKRTVYKPSAATDEPDWYIGSWGDWKAARSPEFAEMHPFGPWFQLFAWPTNIEAIDYFDILEGKKPMRRMMIDVK